MSHALRGRKGVDAMDSAPCPHCDRNRNGIFSDREDDRWYCHKCETRFDGPTPEQLREWRQLDCRVMDNQTHRNRVINGRERQRWGEQP